MIGVSKSDRALFISNSYRVAVLAFESNKEQEYRCSTVGYA